MAGGVGGGGFLEGEAVLLSAQGFDGAFAGGVGGGGELGHVSAGEGAVVVEGILKDGDDCLLELDDLLLELVFCYHWGDLVSVLLCGRRKGRGAELTISHGESTSKPTIAFIILPLDERRRLLEILPVFVASGISFLFLLICTLLGLVDALAEGVELVVLLGVGLLLLFALLDGVVEIHSRGERANNGRT